MKGRYFFAVDLPDQVKAGLAEVVKAVRPSFQGARWVKTENYHITLLFLGEQELKAVQRISALAKEMASKISPFIFVLNGWGFFPNPRAARVMYIGIDAGGAGLSGIARELQDRSGLTDSGKFHPHLSVARFSSPARTNLTKWFEPVTVSASGITLFSSILSPAGPRYHQVEKFYFSGIARGE